MPIWAKLRHCKNSSSPRLYCSRVSNHVVGNFGIYRRSDISSQLSLLFINRYIGAEIAITERRTASAYSRRSLQIEMLKITRAGNGEGVFTVSGRLDVENLPELEALLNSEASGCSITFDLKELTLVDQDVVRFLGRCEADHIRLKNCPAYIREWITRERGQS